MAKTYTDNDLFSLGQDAAMHMVSLSPGAEHGDSRNRVREALNDQREELRRVGANTEWHDGFLETLDSIERWGLTS